MQSITKNGKLTTLDAMCDFYKVVKIFGNRFFSSHIEEPEWSREYHVGTPTFPANNSKLFVFKGLDNALIFVKRIYGAKFALFQCDVVNPVPLPHCRQLLTYFELETFWLNVPETMTPFDCPAPRGTYAVDSLTLTRQVF